MIRFRRVALQRGALRADHRGHIRAAQAGGVAARGDARAAERAAARPDRVRDGRDDRPGVRGAGARVQGEGGRGRCDRDEAGQPRARRRRALGHRGHEQPDCVHRHGRAPGRPRAVPRAAVREEAARPRRHRGPHGQGAGVEARGQRGAHQAPPARPVHAARHVRAVPEHHEDGPRRPDPRTPTPFLFICNDFETEESLITRFTRFIVHVRVRNAEYDSRPERADEQRRRAGVRHATQAPHDNNGQHVQRRCRLRALCPCACEPQLTAWLWLSQHAPTLNYLSAIL